MMSAENNRCDVCGDELISLSERIANVRIEKHEKEENILLPRPFPANWQVRNGIAYCEQCALSHSF